jgi:hypothetical protein
MAETELPARRMSADNQVVSKAEIPLKERFFRYFQHEITGTYTIGTRKKQVTDIIIASTARANGSSRRYISRRR